MEYNYLFNSNIDIIFAQASMENSDIIVTYRLKKFLNGQRPTEELLDIFILEYEMETGRSIYDL